MRAGSLIVRQVGAETVVYDRRRHRAHCLQPIAAAVWRAHDGRRSIAEIAEHASAARGEPIDEDAVRVALRRLGRAGLVAARAAWSAGGERGTTGAPPGTGRREALRRVAALSGLAVLTVVAPAPAQVAASCLPKNADCTSSAQCCSGCCKSSGRPKCSDKAGASCLPPLVRRP